MTFVMDETEKGIQMYKDLKRATILVEDLTDTLNNEDVCFADCINAIIKTANELDECVE